MDPIQAASLEAQLRSTALNQAAHDFRGNVSAEQVVQRAEAYFAFLRGALPRAQGITAEQIKHMVDRFLGWRLPEGFNPDNGISFKATFNEEHMASLGKPPMRRDPTGTNLFDSQQATEMVRHMVEGLR